MDCFDLCKYEYVAPFSYLFQAFMATLPSRAATYLWCISQLLLSLLSMVDSKRQKLSNSLKIISSKIGCSTCCHYLVSFSYFILASFFFSFSVPLTIIARVYRSLQVPCMQRRQLQDEFPKIFSCFTPSLPPTKFHFFSKENGLKVGNLLDLSIPPTHLGSETKLCMSILLNHL